MKKSVNKAPRKGPGNIPVTALRTVWTAARGNNTTVVVSWQGVLIGTTIGDRWLLCKNPRKSPAFLMDANKVYLTREKALASLKLANGFVVRGTSVIESAFVYRDGLGHYIAVDRMGAKLYGKAFPTERGAQQEVRRRLRGDATEARRRCAQALRAVQEFDTKTKARAKSKNR